ncbi:hypothetical protein H5410_057473 [Solanum commersonii]|uniref:Uncharacterized protein n=1 Tax=Solanum commersonii TaxID=4109 RepID=A0A9J5WN08_SOLCO|nr:hypothetical protein H5410_057473 [Solanum commersonii]
MFFGDSSIVATPFKRKTDSETINERDIKNIFEQNNYTNKYLHALGEHLSSKQHFIPTTSSKSAETSTASIQLIKPYEIPRTFSTELQIHKARDFPQLFDLQHRILEIEKSINLVAPYTPDKDVPSRSVTVLLEDFSDQQSDNPSEEHIPLEVAPIRSEYSNW